MNSVGTMFYRRRSVFCRVWLNSKTFNHAAFLTHANHAIHAKMSTHATHAKILWTHAKISTHSTHVTHAKILRTHATHATHAKIWPTPRTHARHPRYLADSSGSWHRCFAVNIAKFLRTLFYGTPPVTASGKNSKISVPAVFDCTWYHGLPLHCDKIAVKHDVKRKIFILESIHTTIQTSKHLNKIKIQFCNDMYSTAEASLHSQSRWCFEIVFWMIECCRHVSIYLYKKKIVWELDVRSHVTQDL